ncbi:MAG: hypothetical protein AUJ52_05510 [Elusimicrobia bacterium CG1_02_63_36]|nr:MAG: hypothetical protein AUJ52_05510 [Elusimicrobia bacterium CG1_02_63_36]
MNGKRARVVFLDRDGTLIHDRPGHYLTRPESLRLYRDTPAALKLLRAAGFRLVVVSNQSGLGRGYLTRAVLDRIHARLKRELTARGAKLDGIYFCPHRPDEGCRCRKPNPSLAKRAARDLGLTLEGAAVVGDKKADVDLGRALGAATVLLQTGHGRDQRARYGRKIRPTHEARGLLQAARWIVKHLALAAALALPARAGIPISSATIPSPEALVGGETAAPASAPAVPWFPEHLEFEVKWGVFSMGEATMEVKEVVAFNGEQAYHIVSRARTAPFADKIYKVRDINESWLRASDLVSLGYSKKLREGNFFRDEWVIFDYAKQSWLSKRVNEDGSFSYSNGELLDPVQDILSSLYFIRPKKLEVGDEIVLDVNTKKTWPLVVKVHRKQRIRMNDRWVKTVLVEPMLRDEGIFIQKGKRLQVWLTDDERHIPVLMKVEIIFGHISCYLKEIPKKP